ncbi:MAG: hypothetical protein N3D10_00105 [Candidatus Micrarchaeota archaeon]|nr:hypothetical protein [Candidatus Micrarchaeota archaeon]
MVFDKILSFFKGEKSFDEEDLSEVAKASPFIISNSFRPIRLNSRKENSVDLVLNIKNKSNSAHLCSVVIEVPNQLGLDSTCLTKSKEFRLGNIEPGQTKELSVPIYASSQTPPATFKLVLKIYSHYRDYKHILNMVRKIIELRAV